MAINDKLNYLIETKQLFKDRLNSLGAEIIESTTFRNYINWLDNFYIGSANKTDIAINGIEGRTSQSGTPTPDSPQPINNLSGNVSYTVSGTNIETRTFIIPLGDIELCEISSYKDKIYSNNGRFYLEKNTNKIILNGDELIDMFSVTGGKLFRCRDIAISVPEISPISNYFKGVPNSSSRYNGTVYYNYNASADRMIFDILTTKFTTVSEFKSWLLTHNTELQFAIPTSTTTEITSSNYPELYSVLKEIQDYLVSYKINKEFLLDYSSPEIEY